MLSEIISANFAGTHSKTIANAPASSTAFASSMSFFAPSSLFPWTLKPPKTFTDWGVSPICAITGIEAAVIALICGQTEAPPSSFTAWHLPSFISLPALYIASSTETWYDINGISPTTKASLAPLVTALVWWIISSIVTGKVFSYPSITMPRESPTRIPLIPDWSINLAVE